MEVKKIKIFLASSKELQEDRKQFEIEIYRKCKMWIDMELFLHLDIWEDLSSRMSKTSSQEEYNKNVKGCDLFILLASTKVGMYTAEEFEQAFGEFKAKKKPFIFTYFKQVAGTLEPSLQQFKKNLEGLGHFYAMYQDSNDLWNQFNKELERLHSEDFDKNNWKKLKNRKDTTVDNQVANIKNQFIGGKFDNPTFN
ncbi:MAG: hypothetical protein WD398_13940 [Cyclobacteriaceae bacterium]